MYLFFDTETTGLPSNWDAPASNTRNWPRMVQIAFHLYDKKGWFIESQDYIIKPDNYIIPDDVAEIHGITTERAIREGYNLSVVLSRFQELLEKSSILVSHNMDFDEKILGCEFYRVTGNNPLTTKKKFCTMKNPNIIDYCALPPIRYGCYKWPKLSELHYKLFGTYFDEAHNANIDIQATARCFFELRRLGVI